MNIANTIKNPRHGDANRPFGATPMTKRPPNPTNPETLKICNDPLPLGRASPGFKYAGVFAQMTLGQCVKCAPAEVGRVSGALKKWISMQSQGGVVRTIKNYGDGMGRVWWVTGTAQARPAGRKAARG